MEISGKIREILEELAAAIYEKTVINPHRLTDKDINEALQAILTEIKRKLPKLDKTKIKLETTHHQGIEEVGYINGWNAYHDEMEKLLDE